MTYTDISATDSTFNNFTSLGKYNSTMNFLLGAPFAVIDGKPIDYNDN